MNSITLKLDFRLVSAILLLVIAGMLVLWKPWEGVSTKRTIDVQGSATVKASPNEFTFSPIYESKDADSSTAISEVSKIGNGVVEKLKALGVAEKDIKTSVNTQKGYQPMTGETDEINAQFSVIAIVNNADLAKKVLDYLATTDSLYGVSPQSYFSNETQKTLEDDARGQALEDAKSRANQTAQTLDVKVGKVIAVSEPQWGGPIYFGDKGVAASEPSRDSSTTSSPVLLTGEQEVTYTVTVSFQIN